MTSWSDNQKRHGRRYSRRAFLGAGLTAGLGLAAACTTEAPKAAITPASQPVGTPVLTPTPGIIGGSAFKETLQQRWPNPPPKPGWPPKYGGQLRVPVSEYANLDPTLTQAFMVVACAYNRLIGQKLGRQYPELFYRPELYGVLAETWEQTDPLTYIFHLRKGVKFHNIPPVNGREFDSTDVKVSLEKYKAGGIAAHNAGDIDTIETPDKYTVKIRVKEPLAIFIEKIATGGSPLLMLPRELWDVQGGPRELAIGTGPYVLKSFDRASGWLLERNKEYFLKDVDGRQLPYLDSFRGFVMKDRATQMAAYRSKQVDAIHPSMLREVEELLKTNPDSFVMRIPPRITYSNLTLLLRVHVKPFDDVRVRRAMSLAIDRDNVIKTVYDGDAEYLGPVPWQQSSYDEWPPKREWLGPWWKYDPAQAKRLLAEAGYPNGFKTKASYTQGPGVTEDALLVLQKDLRQVGIEVEVAPIESAAYNAFRANGNWEGMLFGTATGYGYDWDSWVYTFYHSGFSQNYDRISDADLDKLLEQARRTSDLVETQTLRRKIWERLTDQVYRINVAVPYHYMVSHNYVENFSCNPYAWAMYYGSQQLHGVWLKDDAPGRKL